MSNVTDILKIHKYKIPYRPT